MTKAANSRSKILDIFDVGAKTAAAFAALYVSWIASSWQTTMSSTALMSQREQAESQLRMTMFSSLISPVIGPTQDAEIPRDHEQLLVELLALNFDEHFEVKPLLLRVDQRIANDQREARPEKQQESTEKQEEASKKRKEADEARHSLQSIARRVAARQLALLMKEGNSSGQKKGGMRIDQLTVTEIPTDERQKADYDQRSRDIAAVQKLRAGLPDAHQEAIQQLGGPFDATSPDKRYTLSMVVSRAYWEDEKFDVTLNVMANTGDQNGITDYVSGSQKFTLSWYDFPFIDNTLLADGNRFAVVLSAVDPPVPPGSGLLRTAILHVIWFPKNFFTPRERPTDYEKSLQLVGKNTDVR